MPLEINNAQAPLYEHVAPTESPNFTLTSELLDGAIDTGIGPSSMKLVHPEFPAVLVRQLNPKRIDGLRRDEPTRTETRNQVGFIDALRQKYRDHYAELSAYGIEVPPFSVIQGEDSEIRIVTHKVFGMPLEEALVRNLPGAIEGLDKDVRGELGYLKAVREHDNGQHLSDTAGMDQRMFGHYDGETEKDDRVIFVDIDPDEGEGFRPVSELKDTERYMDHIVKLAFDIVKAEVFTGTKGMQASRRIMREELEYIISNEQGSVRGLAINVLSRLDTNDLEALEEYLEFGHMSKATAHHVD